MAKPPKKLVRAAATAVATIALLATTLTTCDSDDGGSSGSDALSIAVHTPVNSFDPAQLTLGSAQYVWGSVYDTLLYLDPDGKVQPNAAEKWVYAPTGRPSRSRCARA